MYKLSVKNLCKQYKNFAVKNISFDVPEGTVVGLIGENGAGKSTIIKSVLGAIHPDSGQILFDGKPLCQLSVAEKQKTAFVLDDLGLPMELNLHMLNKVLRSVFIKWDSRQFETIVNYFKLPSDKLLKDFSKGMKMQAAIAVALSYDSELLILDEPTSGLDPVVREEIIDMLYDYTQQGNRSVVISSHITTDLEKLCDYIVYVHEGEVVLSAEKDELLSKYAVYSVDKTQLEELDKKAILKVLPRRFGVDVLAARQHMPKNFEYRPLCLDDIMLFYSKGENL